MGANLAHLEGKDCGYPETGEGEEKHLEQTALPGRLTAGGGGYGDPAKRDPKRVVEDVLDGYVSREAAEKVYRVAVDGDRIDDQRTKSLRRGKSE